MDRRESNQLYHSEDDEDDMVPEEFSDGEFENGGRASEHFAPRASVSSQGSRRDPTQVFNQAQRGASPGKSDQEFESHGAESFEMEGESSVVEEVVGEKVVDLDGEPEPMESQDFRNQYLNVDKEEYINKEEYGDEIYEAGFSTMHVEEDNSHELTIQR